MKKLMLAFLLAVFFVMPSTVFAGAGATKFYGYFFDNPGATSVDFFATTWIQALNRNSYPATFTITYYDYAGNVITGQSGQSSYTHSVNPNSNCAWTVSSDLFPNPPSPSYNGGSYVINVTAGSLTVKSFMQKKAGDLLGDPNYSYGDQLSLVHLPVHTVTSTYLNLEGFNLNIPSGTLNGFKNARMKITNPDDTLNAVVKMTFYDGATGNPISINPHDTDSSTTYTFTLTPHQTNSVDASDYIQPTVTMQCNAVFDVIQGSVTGTYITYVYAATSNGIINYRTDGGALTKQLIIQ